jgi:hypothetical protein
MVACRVGRLTSGLISIVAPVEGAEYLVLPDGSGDFATIQAAIDASHADDVIILGDGVFTGDGNRDILVEKAVVIRSQSGDPERCIIDCSDSSGKLHRGMHFRFTGNRSPVLEGVTITGGSVDEWDIGGAVHMWGSSPEFSNCVFSDNSAGQGGAINIQAASPTFRRCLIVGNKATGYAAYGGGVACIDSSPTFRNCTISENSGVGAGVAAFRSQVTMEHSIVSGNHVGKAIHCAEGPVPVLSCSDVFGNEGGDWVGCIADQANVNGNFSLAPLFCDAEAGDWSLTPDSPCAPPGATGCGLVGALDVGCTPVSIAPSTWARIKAGYR